MQNNTPKISIIVPVYNAETYIRECIDSVIKQSFNDYELILIDDGSPDNCGIICDEYANRDSRIKVRHITNSGVSVARNLGIDISQGEYITFLDSDDYIQSNYLECLLTAMQSSKKLGAGIVIDDMTMFDANGAARTFGHNKQILQRGNFNRIFEYLDKFIGCAGAKLFCSDIIKENGIRFPSDITCLEDAIFFFEIIPYCSFINITGNHNYMYRVGHTPQSLSAVIKSFEHENEVFNKYSNALSDLSEKYTPLNDIQKKAANKALNIIFFKIILAVFKHSNNYSRSQRIVLLQKIVTQHRTWMKQLFTPDYIADKIGKWILIYLGAFCFEIYQSFLYRIHFKKTFGY